MPFGQNQTMEGYENPVDFKEHIAGSLIPYIPPNNLRTDCDDILA